MIKKKVNLNTTFYAEEQFHDLIKNTPTRESGEEATENFMHLVCLWDAELERQDHCTGDDAQCSVQGMRNRFRECMRRYAVGVLNRNVDQITSGLVGMKKAIADLKLYELGFGWEEEDPVDEEEDDDE